MATESTTTAIHSDTEYRKWARNLVGKDWEIFWQEEEDGNEEAEALGDLNTEPIDVAVAVTIATTTASGQETAEEKMKETMAATTTNGIEVVEMEVDDVNVQMEDSSSDKVMSIGYIKATTKPNESKEITNSVEKEKGEKNSNDDDDDATEGSVIDDWYDGHVLGITDDISTAAPIGKNGWKFRVVFLGDEEAYEVFLAPNKVRASARGWVQRTIALLNPPITAAGENKEEVEEESNLPPDTSTLEDQQSLQTLKSKIADSSNLLNGLTMGKGNTGYNSEVLSLPSYNSFRRIQSLRFQLESQIYLREKISKIENHSGKELFTNGVRNPTENYVNYLVQCCKDLAQACSWYCKSWKLLFYYFGNTPTATIGDINAIHSRNIICADEKACNTGEEEQQQRQPTDLGKLSFEGLIREYLEFGKNTIVNAAMIDVNATSRSNKRRQAIAPDSGSSSNRRTKRRRKSSKDTMAAGAKEETDETNGKLLTAASKLDTEILSKDHVDTFVNSIAENISYRHIATLGNMLQSLSHLVVDPLVSWKRQSRRILGINNKGNDAYNLMIDRIDTKVVDKTKTPTPDTSSDDEEVEDFFSDEQIEACLSVIRNNNVLSRFNLFDDVHKLHAKLADIQKNEAKALSFLNVLSSDTTIAPKKCYNLSQDNILSGLTAMLNDLDSPESSLYNVDPLSTKKSMSVLTRGDLSKAIELRAWFVGVQHAQSVRERDAFLRRLLSKIEPINMIPEVKDIPVLASIPQICQRREALIQGMLVLQARIKNYSGIIEQRENDFLAASSSAVISNSTNLKSHLTFLLSALSDSKEFPVIFPVEEKIAAQIDLIKWYEKVNNVIRPASVEGNNSLSFFDLKNVYDDLQSVLRGVSFTRATLTDGVESDSKIDEEICKFLLSDLFLDCGKTINEVTTLYHSSSSWKKRAESVILCLRTHGNSNAGKVITLPKLPAMVDIKRIVDLTKEYPGLKIEIPGYYEQLERIQSEAYQWSQNLYTTMVDEHRSFTDALSFIQREKDHRPKGIIIYPTRIVADTTVDFLSWYEKIKRTAKVVAGELKQTSIGDNPQEVAAVYSDLVIREFYPILADGSEALEIYCSTFKTSNEMPGQFKANSDQSLEMLEKHFRIRRTSRAPSREKMNSNDLVSSLLSRMNSKDASEEFPLQLILWFQWHLLVADFVSQRDNDEDSGRYEGLVRSLLQAEQIKSQNPFLARDIDLSDAPNTRTLIQTKTTELLELDRIVEDAQNAEGSIKKGLATTKELLRGSLFEKAERIRKHLSSLRVMQSMLKARSLGNGGLSINGAFENPLEKHIKYFSWLVRTLQYLVLHEGEASYSSSSTGDGVEPLRIPLNALVSIHERMPSEISEFGDPILCVLRVRELYTEAKKWQDEVSRSTLISNRGNKRRGTKLENSMQPENQESDKDAKLRMRKMEMLAEDRILSKVDMPRHKAVKAMVDAKKEFEIQLESFLAQDFDGNQDNAPLPKGDSLVGRNGQFILYRLTGSSLFSMMQTSVQSLATIGDNVFAVTPGKAAFDWMRSAVAWIEELQDAVISQSKFTNANEKLLVIPTKDAKQLCKSGGNIFLQANKDVTQTLSNHGIYVSVNSIKKRLNVRLKKDGAHHSVGGIIIRWCPILFNALRADVTKLESWEDGLQKVVDNFNAFESKSSHANAIVDENNLYQWYCYYMEVQTALEEGQNALVVSPTKDTIDYFTDTLGTIRTHLDKNCSRDAIKEFSKRLFGNSTSLYEDRFDLLDALLYRRETARIVDNDIEETEFSALETKASFRDVCRSNLENALLRAAWVLNLESLGVSGIEDLCALKSWEIELEMFETFQDETTFTVFTVSEVYKVKARSLKSNLENTSNISLCLEVLTDDIKANALVKMTPDQFASRNLKLERERAKQAALTEKLSTPEVDSRTTRENYGKPLKSILRKKNAPSRDTSASPEAKIEEKLVNSCNDDTKVNLDLNADGAPTMDSDEDKLVETHLKPSSAATQISGLSPSISPLNPLPVGNKLKNRSSEIPRSPPPPPPPSLASSFDTTSAKDDTRSSSVDSKSRISNMFGGESFRIELQGQLKYTFSAAFYQEDTSQATVNRFMSESLIQKGRSKIDDFDRFLSEKLRGGRWEATCLKLATIGGDRDATIYKAFYKDFEAKERIAMFKLSGDSGSKLFLVTPKFHHIARRTRGITFGNKNSTYAIVLTKKEDEDMWD
jgi:hypothetical protein